MHFRSKVLHLAERVRLADLEFQLVDRYLYSLGHRRRLMGGRREGTVQSILERALPLRN